MTELDAALVERFWAKVDRVGGCWLWTAAKNGDGYGNFWLGRPQGSVGAHRFAYELLVGPIPEGLSLDHLCRVRNCVRPDHLEPVTNRENTIRGLAPAISRQRGEKRTHCINGHEITPESVRYARSSGGGLIRHCRECDKAWRSTRTWSKAPCPDCGEEMYANNIRRHQRRRHAA